MSIAIISATHRPDSYTRRVALYLAREVEQAGNIYHFIDFLTFPRDFLFSDLFGGRSEAFQQVIQTLQRCPVWIWVIPEYNGSFPGIAKVFIDALPRDIFHKRRAGLVGVSDGRFGNVRGLDHFAAILHYCGMEVSPFRAHLMHIRSHWDEEKGSLTPAYQQELNRFMSFLFSGASVS
ncbi:MAG: NADPH-dependent FMN reductase [Bacteroidia bacterium]